MSSLVNRLVNWTNHQQQKAQDSIDQNLCEVCGGKPKYVQNGYQHPYCGKTCAAAAKAGRNKVAIPTGTGRQVTCSLPQCRNPGRNQFGGYCSDSHARYASSLAKPNPASLQVQAANTGLRELNRQGTIFESVRSALVDSWYTDVNTKPVVEKIFEVVLPRMPQSRFQAYRKTLGKSGAVQDITTYYSSQCICDLGTKSPISLCDYPSCGICTAVKSSFETLIFGTRQHTGRLGNGIYSSTNSSCADKHATSCTSSPYRAMVVCNVVFNKASSGAILGQSVRSVIDGDKVAVVDATAIAPTHVILYSVS